MPQYIVDEFYIIHETLKHMLEDLRNSKSTSGEECQELMVDIAQSITELSKAKKNPKISFV